MEKFRYKPAETHRSTVNKAALKKLKIKNAKQRKEVAI